MNKKWIGAIVTGTILVVFFTILIHAELITDEKRFLIIPLANINQTVTNQSFDYPNVSPNIDVHFVEILPNAESGWHTHEKPLIVTILHGKLTVHYENQDNTITTKYYNAGDAFVEAINTKHNGVNEGIIPVKIHIVTLNPDDNWRDIYLQE